MLEGQVKYKSKVGVIIMNLSKAFDSLNPDLLLAKLGAYALHNHSEFYKMLPNKQDSTLQNKQPLWRMSKNICWGPTRIYIKSATFQYFHQ